MEIVDTMMMPIAHPDSLHYTYYDSICYLQYNEYETEDSWISYGQTSFEGEFFEAEKIFSEMLLPDDAPNRIYSQNIFLSDEGKHHMREVYHTIDVIGDIGGIFEFTMVLFGFFMFPISNFSFVLQASRSMYFARTKDNSLFEKAIDKELIEKLQKFEQLPLDATFKEEKEIKKHHIIRVSMANKVKLYFSRLTSGICFLCWRKRDKFHRLYQESDKKIAHALDVVKII